MKWVKCAVDKYLLAIGQYCCQLRRLSVHAVVALCYGVWINRDRWVKPRKLFTTNTYTVGNLSTRVHVPAAAAGA